MDQPKPHPPAHVFGDLGTLPELLARAQDMLAEGVELESVAEVLAQDMSLTIHLIAAANEASPLAIQKPTNVFAAVNALSRDRVVDLVNATKPRRAFPAPVERMIGFADVWANSVCCALSISALARKLALAEPVSVYPIGLLHKLGRALLCLTAPAKMVEVAKRTDAGSADVQVAEKDIFGITNAETAAALLRILGVPDEIVVPIEFQNNPDDAPSFETETALLHLAAHIAQGVRCGRKTGAKVGELATAPRASSFKLTSATPVLLSEIQSEVSTSLEYVFQLIEPLSLPRSAIDLH